LSLNTAIEVIFFEVELKDGCSAFAWIGCEIVGMHNGRWYASSLVAGTVHSRFLHRKTQAYELKTRDIAEHSQGCNADFVEAN